MEKFIMAGGCALRISDTERPWHEEGATEGPEMTIVLLHGYLESIEVWDDFTKLLKPHMRVVALDLPGHGISEVKGPVHTMEFLADTVHAALSEQGVDRCVVCGHSMGGYVALEMLRKYPESLAGLILFHSMPYADSPEKAENRRREIEIVEAGKKDLLAAHAAGLFARANRTRFADRIEEIGDQAFLTDEEGIVAILRGMSQRRDNNDVLSESKVPVMFILGDDDMFIPEEMAQDMITCHPQARVLRLENTGHMGFIEQPARSAQEIVDFCESLKWDKR